MNLTDNPFRSHAEWYAGNLGLRVFPCQQRGKRPITAHGVNDASKDPEQIAAWWPDDTPYNVGIATGGGIVVLDVDINHEAGKYGDDTLKELEARHGSLPTTWKCLTGGGGIHYYFRCADPELTIAAGFAPGLDYRGAGGYVIAPPSVHKSGNLYEWEPGHKPGECELAQLPAWLHALMVTGKQPARPAGPEEAPQRIGEGGRNEAMFKLASSLRQKGLTVEEMIPSMLEANRNRCDPPLEEEEIRTICESTGRYERGKQNDGNVFSLFRPLTEFKEEEATWLLPGWIPEGQITLIAADGGVGKTTLWVHIVAALSSGRACVLDPPGYTRKPQKVVFCTTEDSVRKKLLKKLREAGANMENIIAMDMTADREGVLREFKFGTDTMNSVLRGLCTAVCIFDPVQGFIPPTINMGSRNAMRDCMAPLISIGEDVGTTFLVICHTNKKKGTYGRYRVADSADLWDIARSVIMLGYTQDEGIRYLSQEKNNYTEKQETILFSIDDSGQIQKEGTTWKRDRDFTTEFIAENSAPKKEDCKNFIMHTLRTLGIGKAIKSTDLMETCKNKGYSGRTIERAKSDLKKEELIKYFKTSYDDDSAAWYVTTGPKYEDDEDLPSE